MNIASTRTATAVALFALTLALTPGAQAQSRDKITPSHVYQATQNLIAEIHVLRDAMGIMDYPPEAEPQEDRAPVHVYAKSLEVMKKISRAQRRLGMQPGKVGQIPVKDVVPSDVLASVETLIWEIRRTKAQLVIEDEIDPPSLRGREDAVLRLQGARRRLVPPRRTRGKADRPDRRFCQRRAYPGGNGADWGQAQGGTRTQPSGRRGRESVRRTWRSRCSERPSRPSTSRRAWAWTLRACRISLS